MEKCSSNLRLGLLLTATGAHFGSWRLPESRPQDAFSLAHYSRIARIAERGLLAAWNLITSGNPAEAWNFGAKEHPNDVERYQRAAEFAGVVTGLWDSWTEDAFCFDKSSGQYFDPSGMHVLNHEGPCFKVRGPLNMARSPQGRPVVAQAGSSEAGRALAARTADIVFTAQKTFAGGKSFYDYIKRRVLEVGRNPDQVLVFPGVVPIVGPSQGAADAKCARLDAAFDPALGIEALSVEFGMDMSIYPLDQSLPPDLPSSPKASSRRQLLVEQAMRDNLSLRQLAARTASLGHWTLCGTADFIADTLKAWFTGGAADGFILMPASQPDGIEDFVNMVVPELQQRELFRRVYESATLRGNLGLPLASQCARLLEAAG